MAAKVDGRQEKILFVNSCVRTESRTLVLEKQVLDRLDGVAEEVNLEGERITPLVPGVVLQDMGKYSGAAAFLFIWFCPQDFVFV